MNPLPPDGLPQVTLTKRQWRRTIIAAITALDPVDRRAQEQSLVEGFSRLPGWQGAGTVLLYVSAFPEEIRTAPFLSMAYRAGKRVILPRVDRSERRLRLHPVSDPERELTPGVLGILEPHSSLPEICPDTVDWALVPGVSFDERGYRLGRGAGHYDRLLPQMRPDCLCWALCLSCQLVPGLPVESHDVPLDGVTSPDRTIWGVRRAGCLRRADDPGHAG
jgi:5-formyltetrahydrofolate cyclo-ligase